MKMKNVQLATAQQTTRRLPIGVELLEDGVVDVRIWAPKANRVEFAWMSQGQETPRFVPLKSEDNGYFSGRIDEAEVGNLYGFRLDGGHRLWPDSASRFQPNGPDGLSEIIDPSAFHWTDDDWQGCSSTGQVIYEMHLGTFTQEGSWEAAANELEELARIGITMIEVMPVADFPGNFGWGYDGVCLFAPTRLYGRPDDFRAFVDRAHRLGLGMILDVVYNHFGNIANHALQFSADYHSKRYANEWGGANNFDGENCEAVREFFVANAHYWIDEFHLDGYRFDATQSIYDASDEHILAAVTREAREAAGPKSIFLVVENEPQDVRNVQSSDNGGFGMDACWNDDFHHAARVRLTGQNRAYYSDYQGSASEFAAAIKHGFLYQGQLSQWQGKPRGTPTRGLPATAFVTFLENHDQVSNSSRGARVRSLASPAKYRAMTALWLLGPQTPLFFQGQEFGATSPFVFFADYEGDFAKAVAEGRGKFLSQFPELATPEMQEHLYDPADRQTFLRCKLNFAERHHHARTYALHMDLLKLRREDSVFRSQSNERLDTAVLSNDCLLVRFFGNRDDDRLLLVNFGRDLIVSPAPEPLLAPPASKAWSILWSSEDRIYGGSGTPALEIDRGWRIPAESAVVLQAADAEIANDEEGQR